MIFSLNVISILYTPLLHILLAEKKIITIIQITKKKKKGEKKLKENCI